MKGRRDVRFLTLDFSSHQADYFMFSESESQKYLQQIPYAADIPGNFYPGRKLYLSALTRKRAKQFIVDFHSGGDIAFRFNARVAEKVSLSLLIQYCSDSMHFSEPSFSLLHILGEHSNLRMRCI